MASTPGDAGTPATWAAWGLTGYTGPANSCTSRLRSTAWPTLPRSRPAPITATERGASSRRTASASARWARASTAASASGVGWRSKWTSITPSSNRLCRSNPALRNTVRHAPVGRQHGGGERADAGPAGRHHQVLQQDGGDAPAPVAVVDEERDLRLGAQRPAVVAGDAHHGVVAQHHERHAVHVVHVGEVVDLLVGEPRVGREVAEVDALRRLQRVELHDAAAVVGPDGADADGAAVGQHDVGVPLRRVRRRDRHLAGRGHAVGHRARG